MSDRSETKKRNNRSSRQRADRRRFVKAGVVAAASGAAVSVIGYLPIGRELQVRLRPPGALDEQLFLASCIKCGQCVQVCPVNAIELADIDEGFGVGTPFVDARAQACDFSCDGLQCVLACPTGALSHDLNYSHEVDMGIAELVNPPTCLAVQGKGFSGLARGPDFPGTLRYDEIDRWNPLPVREQHYERAVCDLCVTHCPIEIRRTQCEQGKPPSGDENQCPPKVAIRLEKSTDEQGNNTWTPVVEDGCVGCGVCEMICPVEPSPIVVKAGKRKVMAA